MGIRLLKIAAVYLVVGTTMGLAMGITQSFTLHPVHAHINLLGWASLALAGVIYVMFPAAGETRLAHIHFWMHNIGLPVFMGGLALGLTGHEAFMPLVEVGATVTWLGLVVFVINVCLNVRRETGPAAGTSRGATIGAMAK